MFLLIRLFAVSVCQALRIAENNANQDRRPGGADLLVGPVIDLR